jgi:hypothetical protein
MKSLLIFTSSKASDKKEGIVLTDISLSGDGKPGHNINIADSDFPIKKNFKNFMLPVTVG